MSLVVFVVNELECALRVKEKNLLLNAAIHAPYFTLIPTLLPYMHTHTHTNTHTHSLSLFLFLSPLSLSVSLFPRPTHTQTHTSVTPARQTYASPTSKVMSARTRKSRLSSPQAMERTRASGTWSCNKTEKGDAIRSLLLRDAQQRESSTALWCGSGSGRTNAES